MRKFPQKSPEADSPSQFTLKGQCVQNLQNAAGLGADSRPVVAQVSMIYHPDTVLVDNTLASQQEGPKFESLT